LEEQRLFYERRLASLHESDHHRVISALQHEKKAMKKSHDALSEKANKLEEELRFVRYEEMGVGCRSVLNESLL
jgi:hypothetical protein